MSTARPSPPKKSYASDRMARRECECDQGAEPGLDAAMTLSPRWQELVHASERMRAMLLPKVQIKDGDKVPISPLRKR